MVQTRTAHILIADDTQVDQDSIRDAVVRCSAVFRENGLDVVSEPPPGGETSFLRASTAAEAEVSILDRMDSGEPFDLAVVDLLYAPEDPGAKTGLATLRALRSRSRDTKIIVSVNGTEDFGRRLALIAALGAYRPEGFRTKQGVGASSLDAVIRDVLCRREPADYRTSMPEYSPDGSPCSPVESARAWIRFLFAGPPWQLEFYKDTGLYPVTTWRQRWELLDPAVSKNLTVKGYIAEHVNPILRADLEEEIDLGSDRRVRRTSRREDGSKREDVGRFSSTEQHNFSLDQLERFLWFEQQMGWDGKKSFAGPATRMYESGGWSKAQPSLSSVTASYSQVFRKGIYGQEFALALQRIFAGSR